MSKDNGAAEPAFLGGGALKINKELNARGERDIERSYVGCSERRLNSWKVVARKKSS